MVTTNNSSGVLARFMQGFRTDIFFEFENKAEQACLMNAGFAEFEDFWQLPKEFVDAVNYRRGGWSGASKLVVKQQPQMFSSQQQPRAPSQKQPQAPNTPEQRLYFVKRQENQLRYSFRKPLGALTYRYEIDAIRRNKRLGLPGMELVCCGIRRAGAAWQGIIVSKAIEHPSLSEMNDTPDWPNLTPILQTAGQVLFNMHRQRIQHGALYPWHIFIDPASGQLQLIDFERSRVRITARKAMARDLDQFIRRVAFLPEVTVRAMLVPYMTRYGKLIEKILETRPKP